MESTEVVALASVERSETEGTGLKAPSLRLTDYLLPSSALLQCRTQWFVYFPHSSALRERSWAWTFTMSPGATDWRAPGASSTRVAHMLGLAALGKERLWSEYGSATYL